MSKNPLNMNLQRAREVLKQGEKTTCIDFDNVIHDMNDGLRDGTIYGDIMPGAKEKIEKWQSEGERIVICTARLNPVFEEDAAMQRVLITAWLIGKGIKGVELTNNKPIARRYIDNKDVLFEGWEKL